MAITNQEIYLCVLLKVRSLKAQASGITAAAATPTSPPGKRNTYSRSQKAGRRQERTPLARCSSVGLLATGDVQGLVDELLGGEEHEGSLTKSAKTTMNFPTRRGQVGMELMTSCEMGRISWCWARRRYPSSPMARVMKSSS